MIYLKTQNTLTSSIIICNALLHHDKLQHELAYRNMVGIDNNMSRHRGEKNCPENTD